MNKIAIIGAGAAGLMAAITAARNGAHVTLYEQNDAPGKKILASGNGKCNIINRQASIDDFEGEAPAFAAEALNVMGFKTFERFCKEIGLLLDIREEGKCYPLSQEARSVQSALTRAAEHLGVRFINDTLVTDIVFENNLFGIAYDQGVDRYQKLIIATGSPAAPQLGGNESGLDFARTLGHSVIDPFPSLVGLHLEHPALAKMAGVKTTARLTLMIDNTPVHEEEGDLLFTRYGVSGFAVLDLSHHASKALRDYAYVALSADLFPRFTAQALSTQLEQMAAAIPDDTLYELLGGVLPRKLIVPLLSASKLAPDTPCRSVNAKTAKKIAYSLKQWRFPVTDTHGYQHAEVAGGGVSTAEIDPISMESKHLPNLYFAGEVIDITGHRGGFNFHFAWGSGFLAGKHAAT